jgi:hypothetical protein
VSGTKRRKYDPAGGNLFDSENGKIIGYVSPSGQVVGTSWIIGGKSDNVAFIDLGDQFFALQKGRSQPSDGGRHFGLVVDDKEAVRKALAEAA